jgi:hypothetical protein
MSIRVRKALFALFLCIAAWLLCPSAELSAQERPVSLPLLEQWLKAQVPSSRIQVYVAELGIDFSVDDAVAARLRGEGASEELIVTLRAVTRRVELVRGPAADERGFGRAELKPIYYGGRRAVGTFLDAGFLSWRGADAAPFSVEREAQPSVSVSPSRLSESPLFYGASLTLAGNYGVDMVLRLHGSDFTQLMAGPTVEPFLPLGTSGYRLILGGTAWLSYTRVGLSGVTSGSPPSTITGIRYSNLGAAGAARLGLAYHYRPGLWIFAESQYRRLATLRRAMQIPADTQGGGLSLRGDDIPWPKLTAGGVAMRLGVGWDFGL